FPNFDFTRPSSHQPRQASSTSQWTHHHIFLCHDGLVDPPPHLARIFGSSMFAVTLWRNVINRGGNLGLLSIRLVESDSLAWVPVRGCASEEGDISGRILRPKSVFPYMMTSDLMPEQTYAIAWEVFIDAVYFDGRRLPDSQLADPTTQNSALIDAVSPFHLV
ncbi:hypothetical protein BDZ89DRAFT_969045, partial [Hymenopellis radicata]